MVDQRYLDYLIFNLCQMFGTGCFALFLSRLQTIILQHYDLCGFRGVVRNFTPQHAHLRFAVLSVTWHTEHLLYPFS